MPYQKPSVQTERTGLPGTPLGNTNFFIPTVIAKTLGAETALSRVATTSGDGLASPTFVNGQMVKVGDTLNYETVVNTIAGAVVTTAPLSHLPVRNVLTVSDDTTAPYARKYIEGLDFTVNKKTGVLDFSAAPTIPNIESIDNISSLGSTGSVGAGNYDFAVVALDNAGTRTLAATAIYNVSAASSSVTVKWGKILTAAGYKVYAQPHGTYASDTWRLMKTVNSGTTTSVVITDAITPDAATSMPATNGTKHTPANNAKVFVNYSYTTYNYNSPKRYFDTNIIQQDHGVGSELANAGRLVIGPAGVGQAAGSMYLVAANTSSGEITGYQDGIAACESIQDLILISTSSSSDTVNNTLKAHCEDMSEPGNARDRFCVVSTTAAIQADTDVSKVTAKIQALNGSNRAMFTVTDGGNPTLLNWQNTPELLNVINGQTQTGEYTANLAVDGPWHAIATAGMICALADPAVPPTNKQVQGISSGVAGTVRLWDDTRKDAIASVGGMVLEDRFNNLFVRHALTVSQASVEDSEVSIVLAEAYMAKRLRDSHQQFIGQKLTAGLLEGVKNTTKKVLDGLVGDLIIGSAPMPDVYQDTANPTKVMIKFDYKPVYPTNTLKFEYGFDLAG